jgi:hypothetical protein
MRSFWSTFYNLKKEKKKEIFKNWENVEEK